jgi:hypothetical protein
MKALRTPGRTSPASEESSRRKAHAPIHERRSLICSRTALLQRAATVELANATRASDDAPTKRTAMPATRTVASGTLPNQTQSRQKLPRGSVRSAGGLHSADVVQHLQCAGRCWRTQRWRRRRQPHQVRPVCHPAASLHALKRPDTNGRVSIVVTVVPVPCRSHHIAGHETRTKRFAPAGEAHKRAQHRTVPRHVRSCPPHHSGNQGHSSAPAKGRNTLTGDASSLVGTRWLASG